MPTLPSNTCFLHTRTFPCSITADCPEAVPSFEGSPGLTVDGQVDPPLEGIVITIKLEDGERLETTTNSMGKYKYVQQHACLMVDVCLPDHTK